MLNKIKQLFHINRKIEELEQNHINSYSFNILSAFLDSQKFIPFTSWSISPSGLLHIINYITINQPKVVVEFGSGITTFYISELIKKNNLVTKFYSVDHDEQWIEIVKKNLDNDITNFILAPLSQKKTLNKHFFNWYDENILNQNLDKKEVELIIIDGPPGEIPFSRAGAFQYFSEQIKTESLTYFLDDSNRDIEKEIIKLYGVNNKN
jgi:hypothetical protein